MEAREALLLRPRCSPASVPKYAPNRGDTRGSGAFEDHPEVIEQFAFEADAVGAHARGEGEAEVAAGQPAGHQARLQQGLSQARLGEARTPLADRLDVVEPAADRRDEAQVGRGRALD